MDERTYQQAIRAAAQGAPYIRLGTSAATFGLSLILAVAGIAVLGLLPLYYIEQITCIDDFILIYGMALAVTFVVLAMAIHIPLWLILRTFARGYGYKETGVEELQSHYYVYRLSLGTFTLKRCKGQLTLMGRFVKYIVLNLWVLPFVLASYIYFSRGAHEVIHQQHIMEAATYDTLQARQFTVQGVTFTMIYVKGQRFVMGATENQGFNWKKRDEDLRHPLATVFVSDFHIGRTEVTNELWDAVMGTQSGEPQLPKTNVSWYECQEFINQLNVLTGATFRLPTVAERELAARGGEKTHDYRYSGSNDIGKVAYYGTHTAPKAVATKTWANELGIFDMSGNVEEWLLDQAKEGDNTSRDGFTNPLLADSLEQYWVEGLTADGSYNDDDEIYCRVSVYRTRERNDQMPEVGLRLVLSPLTKNDLQHINTHTIDSIQQNHAYKPTIQPDELVVVEMSNSKAVETTQVADDITAKEVAVDLGLSVKWCSSNLGAASALEGGTFCTWAEAKKQVPKGWRLPTDKEQRELIKECQWQRYNIDGIDGFLVTARNGNSIFLPAAGYCKTKGGEVRQQNTHGYYWSGSTMEGFNGQAIQMFFTNQDISLPRQDFRDHNNALSVRPVKQ